MHTTCIILFVETPAGSLPYLDADGFMIGSSGAAALYLAREYSKAFLDCEFDYI